MIIDIPMGSVSTTVNVAWHSNLDKTDMVSATQVLSGKKWTLRYTPSEDVEETLGRTSHTIFDKQIPAWNTGNVSKAGPELDIEVDA